MANYNRTEPLNLHEIKTVFGGHQTDHSVCEGNVQCYFRDLEQHLLKNTREADVIVGCVAWLTLESFLDERAGKYAVSLIIQKEDWLRPQFDERGNLFGDKAYLQRKFAKLRPVDPYFLGHGNAGLERIDAKDYSTPHSPYTLEAIRCVGTSSYATGNQPRMHNKFLVFCMVGDGEYFIGDGFDGTYKGIKPYAVWTGSFNITVNATRSFENAVLIKDQDIALQFFREWDQLATFSQALDWKTPEMRSDRTFENWDDRPE